MNTLLTRNFLGSILGTQPTKIALTTTGILVYSDKTYTTFMWDKIPLLPTLELTISGSTLSFVYGKQSYSFEYLEYFPETNVPDKMLQLWGSGNAAEITSLLTDIETRTANEYLKDSVANSLAITAKKSLEKWALYLKKYSFPELDKLVSIAKLQNSEIRRLRDNFVRSELSKYKSFFDSVEKLPLTQKQREACVKNNDATLLLAGAGSGKTSVMIGKTGYLLKKELAKPSEILLLAFGNKAAEEMDERIKSRLHTDQIKALTFHKLGLVIIAEVENKKPSISKLTEEKEKQLWVSRTLNNLMTQEIYRKDVFAYFTKYYYKKVDELSFEKEGEYLHYLKNNQFKTLKNELVKSHGEVIIANWLYANSVQYQYEAPYQYDVGTKEYAQYKPDFYLPEYNIYIEYFGIDEDGNTAPYISKEKYKEGMEWKASTHSFYNTTCINLYYWQHKNNQLTQNLQKELQAHSISFQPIPHEQLISQLNSSNQINQLGILLCQMLSIYKDTIINSGDRDGTIKQLIKKARDPMQLKCGFRLLMPIYAEYQAYLSAKHEIDFEDMINQSINYVKTGKFKSPFKFILVDEFQDISPSRAQLVKCLIDSLEGSSLFCVGDDWQSIYRFANADIRYTTQFSSKFALSETLFLDMTFRFNNKINEVASKFIMANHSQIKKEITSTIKTNEAAVSLVNNIGKESFHSILTKISASTTTKKHVYFLARNWNQLPSSNELRLYQQCYPLLDITGLTFHSSKGKEADFVIIMGMKAGFSGFPSEKSSPAIIEALLPEIESFEYAEERRLFYVAITRARNRVYILNESEPSKFIKDIMKMGDNIVIDEFPNLSVITYQTVNCPKCKTGNMLKKEGKSGSFYSCNNYPYCKHTDSACPLCKNPLEQSSALGLYICTNAVCKYNEPMCKKCGSRMTLLTGRYGKFWGCKTYHNSCDYKIKYENQQAPNKKDIANVF